MSINGDIDVPLPDDQLIQILECPICAEFPSPPIFSCEKGHFICNGCIRLVDACTSCLSPFTQVRNYPLEAIVERTKFKCRYRDLGCEESVLGATYVAHVDNCLFRYKVTFGQGLNFCSENYACMKRLTQVRYFS